MGLRSTIRRYASPYAYLRGLANRRSALRVQAGPFAGMKYVSESFGSAYLPKIVGAYERELNETIETVIAGDHDLIVDIGAAEGYYAVGLAMRVEAPVVAFEMSPRARALAAIVAERNGVSDRIELLAKCEPADLEVTIGDAERPFILCDVEGYEVKLLDPRRVPSLARAVILVEIHEVPRPGVTAELMRRFEPTHEIDVVWQEERSSDEFPFKSFWTRVIPRRTMKRAIEEERAYRQSWLWMTPREAASASLRYVA
ncbi:MAG: class I SAM-dependent methyltransferase [Lacipirellulaceae bacterium]